jgi:hypothetical protein
LKPERKFWLELKKKTPNITWTRIENLALPGVPDLLGYNKKVKSLASGLSYLYEGNKIEELAACGLSLDACCSELDACCLLLESLGA